MKISIIIPCMNEEGNVSGLYNKISETLKNKKYEIIYIDDGSKDKTMEKLHEIYNKDNLHVKVLSFSRNFKKEAAMLAGLEHATGDYTCIIDGDLQQNPSYLLDMINFLDENPDYDEVAMVMDDRSLYSGLMAFCKKSFYKLIDKLSDVHFENGASDFRMFRTNVRDAIISLSEKNRFSKGIFAWIGFKVKYMPYKVEPRTSGKSSFGFISSFQYAFEGILAFSTKPLTYAIKCGVLTLLAAFIYLIVLLVQVFAFDMTFNSIYALILLLLVLFGIQFIILGIIGMYFSKAYTEIKGRPVYIIKEKLGFNEETIL
ncbi:MAG: glycosyltransferase family 2 protein [Candidatus Coprovivens sp.]